MAAGVSRIGVNAVTNGHLRGTCRPPGIARLGVVKVALRRSTPLSTILVGTEWKCLIK